MKTNSFIYGLAITAISAVMLSTGVQAANSDSATATATVIAPIAISNTSDLAFGSFSVGSTGGTVVITSAGSSSSTGDVVLVPSSTSGFAGFDVSGNANATYAITLPTSATISTSGGGASMTVNAFTSNLGATGTLSSAGAQALQIGATLTVGAGQAGGDYTGTFDVTVDYN